ncbi:predicted protein [Candida tropicalis MYA-3404]|uniref:JAB1/MPN/MOV34 metalloenzyme domain-containing protein n=1 Tax=Candida tropicalis (strain ATCC MYA-3404 / T1) TaxID=294747 RepID=C5M5E7_CANTT|nr:predicted protein [Candida tropicalis MYA-3404]EER34217.1 predicted protein [Candida tropicalis MYA-3404]KAG4408083.1 hypothetical protein JTP64_001389 [Candida tropicalis]
MIVDLHSVVLLNLADTLTRQSGNSTGLLLGYVLPDKLVVVTSVELAHEDPEYIQERFNLFKDVYPQSTILGRYNLQDKQPTNDLFLTIDESFQPQCYLNGKLVKTVIDSSETEAIATSTITNRKEDKKVDENLNEAVQKITDRMSSLNPSQLVMIANLLTYHGTSTEQRDLSKATADLAILTSQLLG